MTGNRPVGAVDTMWLNLDRPDNLMVIEAVLWFDGPVEWDRLTSVVQCRLVDRFPVFRQRAVSSMLGLGRHHWEDDPDFSLTRHLHRATLPPPGDEASLQRYVETQMQEVLDRDHPLWQLHLIDGYLGGSALVARFHHAIADGIALTQVLLSLTDATASADLETLTADRHGRANLLPGPLGVVLHGAAHLVAAAPGVVVRTRPSSALSAVALARRTAHIADKLLLGSIPQTPLSGPLGVEKRAVWSSPRPLADVRRIGRLTGATVNDVLMGAVSGALGSYLVSHGAEPKDLTTMVPVNLRPPGEPLPRELGNRFALVLLPLPTGRRTPLERLSETKRRMDRIKRSPEPLITFGLISTIGELHPQVARVLVDFFASKAIGVTTNVIGPKSDRYFCGSRIAGAIGWVPGSGQQAVGVCVFSFNQTVRVGFKVDSGVVPDPEVLVTAFDEELDALLRMAQAD